MKMKVETNDSLSKEENDGVNALFFKLNIQPCTTDDMGHVISYTTKGCDAGRRLTLFHA